MFMRIMHTSDWHIGKKLEERVRIAEQKAVLDSLVGIVKSEAVDLVIVSGDVFDTFTPSAEAENVFYDVLSSLTGAGAMVVIISGNHDDPTRLTAAKSVTIGSGVFFSDGEKFDDVKKADRISALYGDKNYVVFEDDKGEKLYVAMLPYPTEARMKEAADDSETYEDKIKRYIEDATAANVDGMPCILAAHIFMLGGIGTSSERPIELGGARMVSKTAIPESIIYTALGHLHKRQVVDKDRNIVYSGSILQNAFDECGYKKSVTLFDVVGGKVENLREVELEGYCKLEKVSASGFDDAMKALTAYPDSYVELTLYLKEPLTGEMAKTLVNTYPKVFIRTHIETGEITYGSRKLMEPEQLFTSFYNSTYGADPEKAVLELFLRLISEIDEVDA